MRYFLPGVPVRSTTSPTVTRGLTDAAASIGLRYAGHGVKKPVNNSRFSSVSRAGLKARRPVRLPGWDREFLRRIWTPLQAQRFEREHDDFGKGSFAEVGVVSMSQE